MLGHILLTAVNAVVPIVLLIALGYWLKKQKFLDGNFLKTANWLVFHVCLPAMLFVNVYSIESITNVRWDVIGYCVIVITVLFIAGWGIGVVSTKERMRIGAIWQCTFRSNFAIIGLPLAQSLGGDEGAAMAAVLSAFTIPFFNIYSIAALSVYTGKRKSVWEITKSIFSNPLTIGVIAGIGALLLRAGQLAVFDKLVFSLERDIPFAFKALTNLKAITSPLALIVLGGQSEFSAVRGMLKEITVATTARIVFAPVVALSGALVLSNLGMMPCGNGDIAAIIALFGSPVAVSSAIMAANMDCDKQLATQLVVWTSVLSVATIFLTVCILMGIGVLNI